jgi:hypothetical protein
MQEIRNGKFGPVEPFNGDALSKKLNDQEVDHVEVFNGTKENIEKANSRVGKTYKPSQGFRKAPTQNKN